MNEQHLPARVKSWLTNPMSADVVRSIERLCQADDVRQVAVMPDVHLAADVCVGVAVATEQLIYPAAIGSDIGCGMLAVRFEAEADLLADARGAARVMASMYRLIPSIKHAREQVPDSLPKQLADWSLSDPSLEKLKDRDGRFQFGTLGRGNHFVELQADEQDRLWLMVHSGSRSMGQAITSHHLKKVNERDQRSKLRCFDADSTAGQAYLADVSWAIAYAAENRLAMSAAVAQLLGELFDVAMAAGSLIHSDHNHVRREAHGGKDYWVHRKGALSAAFDEPGVIPGSMGAASFHVVGRGVRESLCSSSHGAGRAMSRGEAATRINVRRLEREMDGVWFDHRRAALLRDEAPSAYKDIYAVMRAQRELTKIERQLRPILSYKGV